MADREQGLFFELIQISLGQRDSFSQLPSSEEWYDLYDISCKQAVAGVMIQGLEVLSKKGIAPPQALLLEWIGLGEFVIKPQNSQLDSKCVMLLSKLGEEGLHATILKGQGIAKLYGEKLSSLRQPGDIDVYVSGGIKNALSKVRHANIIVKRWDYKHAHLQIWDDVEIELHYHVEIVFNIIRNRDLQRWFNEHEEMLYQHNGVLVTPTIEINVFYILLHIYRHFFTEGIGIRQMMDYYFVLRQVHEFGLKVDDSIYAVSRFGLERFAKGLMWAMKEVFNMPEDWMLWDWDEKEGRFILAQVMEGGNFGHYKLKGYRFKGSLKYVESITRHSLHLVNRYPFEALWTPIWIAWHKWWKITESIKMESLVSTKKS